MKSLRPWRGVRPALYRVARSVSVAGAVISIVFPALCHADQSADDVALGRELFAREWLPQDPRGRTGDGLGPVFNDTSCVSCHNQGGPGGGGPASKNVQILNAFRSAQSAGVLESIVAAFSGGSKPNARRGKGHAEETARKLANIHPGFRTAHSVVIHRFGTDPEYEAWRWQKLGLLAFANMLPQRPSPAAAEGADARARAELEQRRSLLGASELLDFMPLEASSPEFALTASERNPIALFGAGFIDAVPIDTIEAAAASKSPKFPEISGRVSRPRDGQLGRFGWKAQTATLEEFVLQACALELGLDVPGHQQAGDPRKPKYKAPGLDLTESDCQALVAYVHSLDPPLESSNSSQQPAHVDEGRDTFARIGCAACHLRKLGNVDGIYSDLLLHDMGPLLADTGRYGVFVPDSPGEEPADGLPTLALDFTQSSIAVATETREPQIEPTGPATRLEWRTPPLWGVRDSGPYMHHGAAQTLEEAVAFHGGEAEASALRFFQLSAQNRLKVIVFLKSLTAPEHVRVR